MINTKTNPATDKIPINSKLPRNFSCTANEDRPASHQKWWHVPYIQTQESFMKNATAEDKAKWLEAWPSGTRYDVRCLDGGAWDRPTCWGMFKTLEEAEACARTGPSWGRKVA
jgi:hypothetical protein